ncbi:hypothetical protein SUGI_0031590 [Cryptomeria japonica]|uniref:calcium/calmodulin-regulated receptor-like kinase 1 n=1 Tax=Cryptomeria japonica TaxID=3369 RepID=UPI002408B384|nr:calcium/calmodulin-regulated receptor-like kinase 1 [Cryptomeria japonica]GLJ06088.1 hypothetical protein SUGI_0031590 [Cryptomeria japonica]
MDENISIGLLIGIAGGFTFVIAAGIISAYLFRRKHKDPKQQQEQQQQLHHLGQKKEQTQQSLALREHARDSTSELSDCWTEDNSSDLILSKRSPKFLSSLLNKSESLKSRRFSHRELEKATTGFTNLLGAGAFGSVFKATFPSGKSFAVKVLNPLSDRCEKEFLTEVMLLERLHHRNLVNLIGYCMDKQGHRSLIYEYMSNGSLYTLLHDKSREPLGWEERVNIAQDMARGIEYLHKGAKPPVIHRDIKSANILIDSTMTARVADFGLYKDAVYPPSVIGGTCGYVDPEYVRTNTLTDKSDIYSFGVLLFELVSAVGPQQGLLDYVKHVSMSEETEWLQILDPRLHHKFNSDELEAMISVALECIHEVPRKRPNIQEISLALSNLRQRISFASIP